MRLGQRGDRGARIDEQMALVAETQSERAEASDALVGERDAAQEGARAQRVHVDRAVEGGRDDQVELGGDVHARDARAVPVQQMHGRRVDVHRRAVLLRHLPHGARRVQRARDEQRARVVDRQARHDVFGLAVAI